MSENFQLHLVKCLYSKCYYNQNLTVSKSRKFSLLHMMHAIAHAHSNILATSLMRVKEFEKNWNKENERKKKHIKFNR